MMKGKIQEHVSQKQTMENNIKACWFCCLLNRFSHLGVFKKIRLMFVVIVSSNFIFEQQIRVVM